jgi:hypothetical protein
MSARGGTVASRALGWLPVALLLVALVPPLLKLPAVADFAQAILTYPFQVDDSEGVVLSEAQWLARGVDPYQPARPDFFTAAPYTPIYTAINALAFAAGPFTFKIGRGIAFLATLMIAAGIAALVRRGTGNWALALWAGLTTLTINLVGVWAVRARPDHLALACNLAGVGLVYWRWEELATADGAGRWGIGREEWRLLWAVAGCCALGFFTKQTLLAAPVAIGLCLLVRRWRLGIAFGLLYGVLVVLPFGLLTLVTHGGFYQHIIAFHSSWSWHDFWRLWEPFVVRYWPLLVAAIGLPLAVVLAALRGDRTLASLRADRDLLPAVYFGTAAFFGLGAGTHGGNHNHFVETVVVAIWCAALLVGRGLMSPRWRVVAGIVLLALSIALGLEARFGATNWLARDFRTPLTAEREGWANVAAFVTNDPGPVYADNVGLLLVAGKEVRYTDPFSLAYATRTGQWDDRELVARVLQGEFSLIALRYDVFSVDGPPDDLTEGLYEAIRARYRVIERNVVVVYAPR